jgi:acyl-CoA synthetase (AMP-forming)/AMP-acid ligase II
MSTIALPGQDRVLMMFGPAILDAYTVFLTQFARGGLLGFTNNAVDAVHLCRAFGFGSLVAPAPLLHGLLKAMAGRPAIAALRSIASGGARMPLPVLREMRQTLTPNVLFSYGSTEAGIVTYGTGATIEREEGATGYLLPGIEMQVVDKDHRPLPARQTGIIRVKTPYMAEYLSPTPDTIEMFRDGWFYPGDVGTLDEKNQLMIVGRTTELINYGGTIVAPEYVDEIFRGIAGVKDAATFGVMNPRGLEEIWTALVLAPGADPGTIANLARPLLADRQPQRVVVVDAIPRGEIGKVKRAELRETVLKTQRVASG